MRVFVCVRDCELLLEVMKRFSSLDIRDMALPRPVCQLLILM
jgi:hypothetical protein